MQLNTELLKKLEERLQKNKKNQYNPWPMLHLAFNEHNDDVDDVTKRDGVSFFHAKDTDEVLDYIKLAERRLHDVRKEIEKGEIKNDNGFKQDFGFGVSIIKECDVCDKNGINDKIYTIIKNNYVFDLCDTHKDAMDDCVSAWISYLVEEEGMDQDQAVAVAHDKCERGETPPSS